MSRSRSLAGGIARLHRATGDRFRSRPPRLDRAEVSVVIPTRDAGEALGELLTRLRDQRGPRRLEILVVDSGSRDATLAIAREHGARTISIPPEEFSHSGSRNLGASHATGDYLLFTVQDALPPDVSWLAAMLEPFRRRGVAAVSCAEAPRPDADLFYRVMSWNHTRFLGLDRGDAIHRGEPDDDAVTLRRKAQLSDTACLIPRRLFARYRYRGGYGEDLDLGLRLLADGYRLALLGSVTILHSHVRSPYYHLRRGYVDNLALLRMVPGQPMHALEPHLLLRSVVFALDHLHALVHTRLDPGIAPLSLDRFRSLVMDALALTAPSVAAATPAVSAESALDAETAGFVERTRRRLAGSPTSASPREEATIVLGAVRSFIGLTLDYLAHAGPSVDRGTVAELSDALFKTWAFQSGALLASAYFAGPEDTRLELAEIHRELSAGV